MGTWSAAPGASQALARCRVKNPQSTLVVDHIESPIHHQGRTFASHDFFDPPQLSAGIDVAGAGAVQTHDGSHRIIVDILFGVADEDPLVDNDWRTVQSSACELIVPNRFSGARLKCPHGAIAATENHRGLAVEHRKKRRTIGRVVRQGTRGPRTRSPRRWPCPWPESDASVGPSHPIQ